MHFRNVMPFLDVLCDQKPLDLQRSASYPRHVSDAMRWAVQMQDNPLRWPSLLEIENEHPVFFHDCCVELSEMCTQGNYNPVPTAWIPISYLIESIMRNTEVFVLPQSLCKILKLNSVLWNYRLRSAAVACLSWAFVHNLNSIGTGIDSDILLECIATVLE